MLSISQRYYYYIHNGIDTEHVAPMEDLWLDHVLALVPNRCFLNFKIFFIWDVYGPTSQPTRITGHDDLWYNSNNNLTRQT